MASSRPLRGVLLLLLRHAHMDAALQSPTLGGHPLLLRLLQSLQVELGSISWLVPAVPGDSAEGTAAAAAAAAADGGYAAGAGSGETALERYLLGSVVPLLLCAYGGALTPADEQEAGGDLMAIVEARAAARVAPAAAEAAAEEEEVGRTLWCPSSRPPKDGPSPARRRSCARARTNSNSTVTRGGDATRAPHTITYTHCR